MSAFRVDMESAVATVTAAQAFDWTWEMTDAERFAESLGWTVTRRYRTSLVARTTFAVDRASAHAYAFRGRLGRIDLNVTDNLDPAAQGASAFLAAVFEQVRETFTGLLGQPEVRETPAGPVLVWRAGPVLCHVEAIERTVELTLASPEFQEYLDTPNRPGVDD